MNLAFPPRDTQTIVICVRIKDCCSARNSVYSQNWERLVKLFTFVGREAGKISETRDIEEPCANFKY